METLLIFTSFFLFLAYGLIKKEPLIILPLYLMSASIYAYLGSDEMFKFALNSPFQFHALVSDDTIINTYHVFLIAAWSFVFGVFIVSNRITSQKISAGRASQKYERIFASKSTIILLYVFTLAALHLGWGAGHLYDREGYTLGTSEGTYARTAFVFLLPVISFLLPVLPGKILRAILLGVLFLLVQGLNSRSLVLIPVFYFLGTSLRDMCWSNIKFLFCALTSLFSLVYVLDYRDNYSQGVFPNISYLFNNGVDFTLINISLNYIFAYSFYATAYTIGSFELDFRSFAASLNPLPSAFLNIEHMNETQKLNENAPYTAIGTLALAGNIYLAIYFFFSGLLWKAIRRYFSDKSPIILIIVTILFLLFTIFCSQYNLRGITRYVYYSAALVLVVATLRTATKICRLNNMSLKR